MGLTFTQANGNELCIGDSAIGTERESAARRLAADLDRADERVQSIDQELTGVVCVWLATPSGEGDNTCHRFRAPDGWRIVYTDVVTSGAVCVGLEPEADR